MYSSLQLYLIVGVIAFLTHSAFAVKCYSCESDDNPNCGEYFNDDGIPTIDCQHEPLPRYLQVYNPHLKPTGCKKLILESSDGRRKTERFCYYGDLRVNDTSQGCRRDPSFQGRTIKCEICAEDLCNSSIVIEPKIFEISLLILTICGGIWKYLY